jgi:DnaJ family protein C protein 1
MKLTCCLECRYDFFYKNGVPRWRGTGYYYSRFRPGLGVRRQFIFFYASILTWAAQTVLVFLAVLSTGLHYVIQRINYKRDLARIEYIISQAKQAAWGPKLLPVGGRRKVGFLCHFRRICLIQYMIRSK